MTPDPESSSPQRALPAVGAVLRHVAVRRLAQRQGRDVVRAWVREAMADLRRRLAGGERTGDRADLLAELVRSLEGRAAMAERVRLGPVINATGVILHTGLGRAPLSAAARAALAALAGAGNVEFDLETGARRERGHQLQPLWQALTGCEEALVVNNNAAATLLVLQALCAGREVILARGQLVEIGGSFRLPEILALSGARLREVGTTNRTRLSDYEQAIGSETAALMHVHPSNYRIVGFAESPDIAALADLARRHGLLTIDDIGSGSLIDVTRLGLPAEPTFPQSLAAGADVVLGSGDKLLGGPQAGIILGRAALLGTIRRHPLARAIRVDKFTLAALGATLETYLRGDAEREIPVLRLLATPVEQLRERAAAIRRELGETVPLGVEVRCETAPVGGGSLPTAELPTAVLHLTHPALSADQLAQRLRLGTVRVVPRIHQGAVLIDLRSVPPEDDAAIRQAIIALQS